MPVIPEESAELVEQLGEAFDGVISSDDGACLQWLPSHGAAEMEGTSAASLQESGFLKPRQQRKCWGKCSWT